MHELEWPQNDPGMTQNDLGMTLEWHRNDTGMTPEWLQNDPRMTPEWNFQSMTCDLFWLAALAASQHKSPPEPQLHTTCFFDGRNSQLATEPFFIEAPN